MFPNQIKFTLENQGYTLIDQVGQGLSAQCYRVKSEKYNQTFVVKILPKRSKNSYDSQETMFKNEVAVLSEIQSENVVNLYEFFEDCVNFYMILEYCPTNVLLLLQSQCNLDPKSIEQLIYDITNGLLVLHKKGIAHLDIKPQNILIDAYNRAKIIDFGFAEYVDEERTYTHSCGTYAFMAPELIQKQTYNPFKADIWSFGMTLYYIFKHQFPKKVTSYNDFWDFVRNDAKTIEKYGVIIQQCINYDPEQRPTIEEIKRALFPLPTRKISLSIPVSSNMKMQGRRGSFITQMKRKLLLPSIATTHFQNNMGTPV